MSAAGDQLFLVFGREAAGVPLQQVGIVRATNARLAFVYARMTYTERKWRDLHVAPKDAFYALDEVEA